MPKAFIYQPGFFIRQDEIKDAAVLLRLSLVSSLTQRLSGSETEQFRDDRVLVLFEDSHYGQGKT